MKRVLGNCSRVLSAILAAAMLFTSVPTTGLTVSAAEVTAMDVAIDDEETADAEVATAAEASAEAKTATDEETPADVASAADKDTSTEADEETAAGDNVATDAEENADAEDNDDAADAENSANDEESADAEKSASDEESADAENSADDEKSANAENIPEVEAAVATEELTDTETPLLSINADTEELTLSSEDDYTWDEDGTTITGLANTYTSKQRLHLIFPEKTTSIGERAFSNKTNIVSISFAGDNCTSIGLWAFISCTNLETAQLSDGITEIGVLAFRDCTALREIHMPENLRTIGEQAFYQCTSLTELTIPAGMSKGVSILGDCPSLTKLIFAEGTKVVYNYGSGNIGAKFPSITTVVLPDSVEEIGSSAFYNFTGLKDIELPANLKKIGGNAFNGCESLTSINLQEGLESIGAYAFENCTSLTEVYVPGTAELGTVAFYGCSNLTSIEFGEGTTKINRIGTTALVHVKLPSTVTKLYEAFKGCNNLQTVNLPASLKEISSSSFASDTGYLDQITELRFEGDGDIKIIWTAFNNDGGSRDIPVYCVTDSKVYNYFKEKKGFTLYGTNGITYELNGGTNAEGNPVSYVRGDDLTFQDPSREGYNFAGWYTDANLTNRFTYEKGTTDGNLTLYAAWREITYKITYDLDGGAFPGGYLIPSIYTASKDYTLVAPTKAGSSFAGWKVNDTEDILYSSIPAGAYSGDLTLTALWEEYTYQILWDKNAKDATGTMEPTTLTGSEEYTIPAGDYDRAGYDVAGWNTKANGKGTAYGVGDIVQGLVATEGGSITLYAQWQKSLYEITYELNGGTNNKSNPDSYQIGKTVSLKNPTREGYIFGGWYADEACTTKIGKITTSMGDVTVYAQWTPITYTITFNKNKGTLPAGQTMDSIVTSYDQLVTLPANAFERTGYTFNGWSTTANGKGGVSYDDGEEVFNLTSKNKAKVTLYAQWKVNETGITYELNGGTNSAKNPAVVTIEKDVRLQAPTRNGYTFKGWYTDADLTTALARNTIAKTTTDPVTVYAAWDANTYTLRLDKNSGTYVIPAGIAGKYAYTDEITLPDGTGATRANYTLTGWNTRKDRSGDHYGLGDKVSGLAAKGTVTLYAEWTPNEDQTYTITYHLQDETEWDNSKNPTTVSFEKDAKLVNPTRTGYTFKGWYAEDPDTNPKARKVTTISRKTTANVDVYGVWTENTYTITYNGNKGTLPKGEKMTNITTEYSIVVGLGQNRYERKGYRFTGWNTKANGTGDSYRDGKAVSCLTDKNKGRVTMYAQWEAIPYDITYVNVGLGEGATLVSIENPNPESYTIEKDVKLSNPDLYGYTFKGWYAEDPTADAKAKKVTRIARNTAAATTVYGLWSENSYSLRFSTGTSTSVKAITNKRYTQTMTIPSTTPTKEGYEFQGWALTRNGEALYHPGQTVTFEQIHADGGTAKGLIGTKYIILYAVFTVK